MTQQRHRDKRRTFLAPQSLWSDFCALHGPRGAGRRLRALMLRDLEEQRTSPTQWYLRYLEDLKREMPPAEDRGHQERNSIEQTEAG